MPTLLHIWDLITSDAITLAATSALAIAILTLLAFASWPARAERMSASPRRSTQARALFASGSSAADVSRRTGLSRDALALMSAAAQRSAATAAARQKEPKAARLAFRWRSGKGV
ncbi:MAG: hypothetical protein ABIT38_09260, partial [Gemmatimonadaceae bacterium]